MRAYDWTFLSPGQIQGVGANMCTEQRNIILLEQESDGLHWSCRRQHRELADSGRLSDAPSERGSEGHCILCASVSTRSSMECSGLNREQTSPDGVEATAVSMVYMSRKSTSDGVETRASGKPESLASRGISSEAKLSLGTWRGAHGVSGMGLI